MIAYLSDHEHYHPMNSWNGGFVLAWNIKVYSYDEMGKSYQSEYPTNDRFDDAWKEYVNSQDGSCMFFWCCEDATRLYLDAEWTNYPGIEQGEWNFSINGRSGGYMILTHCPSWVPAPRTWKMYPMIWADSGHFCDWLNDRDFNTLRRFYKAIRVLDHDLREEACDQEVSYHFASRRYDWEQERLAEEQEQIAEEHEEARAQEASRPDMYATN
jgi:hypothetical protein